MIRIRKGSTILLLVVIGVTALVLVLAVLQFRWLNQLSQADEQKLRRSLYDSTNHILDASRDEVQVLMALLTVSPDDFESGDWQAFAKSFRLWKNNTRFPDLVSSIYLFSEWQAGPTSSASAQPSKIRALRYDEDQDGFVPAEVPDIPAIENDEASLKQLPFRQPLDVLDPLGNGYIFMPIYQTWEKDREATDAAEAKPEDHPKVLAVIAIQIDCQIIFREIVPYYTDYYLKDYPYRIVKTVSRETIIRSGQVSDEAEPEITVPLQGGLLFDARILGAGDQYEAATKGEGGESPTAFVFEQYGQEDPSVRFWLQRFLPIREPEVAFFSEGVMISEEDRPPADGGDSEVGLQPDEGEEAAARREAGRPPESEYALEIFYPGRPLDDLVQARLWSNMGVSLGILILLVASMLVLLRFYHNTEKLREMEQEFVASMSHELRTPIAVLQSTSENLKKGVVTDASRLARYGTIIHREVKRLSRTLEGILLYSGLEKRSWNGLQSTGVDLGQLVRDVVESLREPAEEAQASIVVHQNIPDHRVITDATGLRLILENLIINAIRHGLPEADKADTPREIRLYIKSQRLGRELSIRVEDNGTGISAKESKAIFDPFVRGEASVSAQRPGSGLGLHLVKQVVKILGGTISLESPYLDLMGREQSGCRFVVLVPIQQEETGER